ncbi:MAG: right-handed parallel beta-helix repeat-containing protein [Pseudomonadota bacterium]
MTIFNVSNSSQLMSALNQASGGDEIRLASGDYGDLNLDNVSFNSPVTITSANDNNPASFAGMDLDNVNNLTFDNVVFDYTFNKSDSLWGTHFSIDNSSNIDIENSVFSGDLARGIGKDDDGFGYGRGLIVSNSSDVTVSESEFFNWWKAASFIESQNINFTENEIHSIRSDGLNFREVKDVLVEGNYIHDFDGSLTSGDHKDFLQVWTTNTDTPTENLTIRGNVFDIGEGTWAQTIFMRNIEGERGNTDLYYRNITIEDNTIYNSHANGIVVGATDGLVLQNNTLIQAGDPETRVTAASNVAPRISVSEDSSDVYIANNAASRVIGYESQSDWDVRNNVEIQNDDPSDPGYYGNVFNAGSINTGAGVHAFTVKEGSILDQFDAGSALTLNGTGTIGTPGSGGGSNNDAPDATDDTPDAGGDAPETPDTGSDTSDTGDDTPDTSDTDTDNNGGGSVPDSDARIDDFVLDIAALDGSNALQRGAEVEYSGSNAALDVAGGRSYVDIGRLTDFEDSDQLAFAIEFSRDVADGSDQRLLWNHKKFGVTLEDDGLSIQIGNNDGAFWEGIKLDDLGLNDTDTHKIVLIADADADRLQVIVDDQLVLDEQDIDLEFANQGGREWGWTVGSKWGSSFDGNVTDFRVEADADFVDPSAVTEEGLFAF